MLIYTLPFKSWGLVIKKKKKFNKDVLNWLKVTVKMCYKLFLFKINAVLLNLQLKEWKNKILSRTTV